MKSDATPTTPRTVTVLVGSGRKTQGATYQAARRFLDHLEAEGDVRGEILFLCDFDLGLCRGCKVCFTRGEERCPLRGDRDVLLAKMMASDGVVFASPNYSFQVSAVMKAFLDRLGFVFHRPCFHGKVCTAIVVQGIYGGGRIESYLRFVGNGLGFDAVKGSVHTALEPMSERQRQRTERALAKHSRRFSARLRRSAHAAPSLFKLMVFRMARTSMRQMLDATSRDYAYYDARGWFDADYYHPTELGLVKRTLGRLFDWLFGRIYRPAEPLVQPQRPHAITEGSKS